MSSTPSRSTKQSRFSKSGEASQPLPPATPESSADFEPATEMDSEMSAKSTDQEDSEVKLVRPVRPTVPAKLPTTPPATIVAVVSKGSQSTTNASLGADPSEPSGSQPSSQMAAQSNITDGSKGASNPDTEVEPSIIRQQPIPPPSERMQYRAIGLIRGKYVASPEQLTRGNLFTPDGTTIDAVLLGRVISLIKKHIDLEEEHLWVVYPRTREKENDLHAQIVGIWEPEKLHKLPTSEPVVENDTSTTDGEQVSTAASQGSPSQGEITQQGAVPQFVPSSELTDGYFSIRGEVIYHSEDDKRLIVKICQTPRKSDTKAEKAFKLLLQGEIEGDKVLGRFWDLHVQRQADQLVIQSASPVGIIMPKKPAAGKRSKPPRSGGKKPWQSSRPARGEGSSRAEGLGKPATSSGRREPSPKPTKRRDKDPMA